MNKLKIFVNNIELVAELNDSETAHAVWDALPIEGRANRWGKEIYFGIPVAVVQEPDARADVEVGTIAYWPPGHAFCLFWGATPVSIGNKPRAASPVNIFGSISGDLSALDAVNDGDTVKLSAA